ncbi:ubiquitin-associated protein 1 isoform X1 [Limanda limanda]|uniref:ubiquitin-associated protein 1 isoform X1 n=2 Tax=Limanda limanda TaxID=27771 RepID=UPI0029C8FD5B|nr:ubiquitin-associated protein 1 isoform X1 [Limanda limanda]
MAARKSGSDAYNNGPISYLDEVPFKINDKFRCPAKVGLPVGFCLPDCGSLLVDTQYDFSLERRSVRWGVELAEARAAEARAEEAAHKQEADSRECLAKAQDIDGGGGKKPRSAADDQDLLPPAMNPVLARLSHNDILTPLPATSLGPRKAPPSIPQLHSLNLADFEREEDPFDKLELKTLDDREELRNILQSQPQPQPPPSVSPPELSQIGSLSRGNSPSPPSSNTSLPAKQGFTHKPNGLVALLDMDRVGHHGRVGFETDDRPCNIRSLTFPKLSDSGDPEPVRYSHFPAPIPAHRQNLPNGSPPTTPKTQVIVAPEPPSHIKSGPPKQTNPGSAGLPCGGALLSMTPSERQCVETLVGMGYSYEGVLRAMQRQGQNVEQVLDYLILSGRLCDRGFDASQVEECLEMYQCSEEKTLQFLELMSRFGEMGFERDAIKEVLLVHNNDQDKALEDLMGRAAAS